MQIRFEPLLTLEIAHGYYDALCPDLAYMVRPGEPALAAGKLLIRPHEGRLVVLHEVDKDKKALRKIDGSTLLIGLRPLNPALANFTAPVVDPGFLPLFANSASPTAFDPALPARLLAARQRVLPSLAPRPLTLRWARNGMPVAEQTLRPGDADALFETRDWPAGHYTLTETAGGPSVVSHWLQLPEWGGESLWGVLAVTIDASFYTAPPALRLSLQARTEHLQYFVVARNFGSTEFSQIQFADAGAVEQGRSPLVFDRILPTPTMPGDMPPSALGSGTDQYVLFPSRLPLPRRAGGYRKLQLRRNTQVLIPHLPQAGTDRAQARFIVHLAKS